jgi:hypothetical protein
VIWNKFPFGEHVARMRERHPDWSERQLACCLYWQGTARKQLEAEIEKFRRVRCTSVFRIPEAHGVNVTATMERVGVYLEWPPKRWAYQVAIAIGGKDAG